MVRLGVAGDCDLSWLGSLPGATVTRAGRDFHELRLRDGLAPARILREALARDAQVTRFEIAQPSIEDIFVELVGAAAATDERTLAPGNGEAGR